MEFPLKSMKLTFSRGLYRVVLERPRLLRLWRLLRIPRWCVFDSHPRWDPCLSLCPENHPIWARNERILQRKFNWSTYCNIVIFERTPKPKRAWNNIEGSKQTLNVSWEPQFGHAFFDFGDKLREDWLLDEKSRSSGTNFALVEVNRVDHAY